MGQSSESILSPLELLPRELVWAIIEYVPEAVFELRLTSRILRSLVDDFARQTSTIPLVEELMILGNLSCSELDPPHRNGDIDDVYEMQDDESVDYDALCYYADEERFMKMKHIELIVPKSRANLLELRLLLENPDYAQCNAAGLLARFSGHANRNVYFIQWSIIEAEGFEPLSRCIGRKIDKLTLIDHSEAAKFDHFFKLFHGIQFSRLKVMCDFLSDENCSHLLQGIATFNIDKLSLYVHQTTIAEPEQFLLHLSSLVRSLRISQLPVEDVDDTANFFLGREDVEWAPVFLEMFANKLDKLCLESRYLEYLTRQGAELLRTRLPTLGKPIWFEACCDKYPDGLDYICRDHVVKADAINEEGANSHRDLTIKHSSRVNEQFSTSLKKELEIDRRH